MENHYRIDEDCRLFRELRRLSQTELANKLGLGLATVNRWENMQTEPAEDNLEKFYVCTYRNSVRLNNIKEQFFREELKNDEQLLFHGAITTKASYSVNTEWMLTIASFRGKLKGRVSAEQQARIRAKADIADYIIAPIADNRMYQIIDGEITDEQCRHALAATELGMQYVIKTNKAAKCAEILERCFLCTPEKNDYTATRKADLKASEDKVRAARIKYRGKGKYIDELL